MNTPELVEWQRIDPQNGLVEPWWTWPCMDVIKTWDLKDKTWLEFGSGLGTPWLRQRCKWVDSIEANREWFEKVTTLCASVGNVGNGLMYTSSHGDIPDGVPSMKDMYLELIPNSILPYHVIGKAANKKDYDIISVDGIYRNECLEWSLNHFKGRGGILVVDNLDQDYVWISPSANELMAPYPCEIYYQPGHTNHEGKPWSTRIYTIPA